MTRRKHRNDANHGKNGWVGGNPRYKRHGRRGKDCKLSPYLFKR